MQEVLGKLRTRVFFFLHQSTTFKVYQYGGHLTNVLQKVKQNEFKQLE